MHTVNITTSQYEIEFDTPLGVVHCGIRGAPFDQGIAETINYTNGQSQRIQTLSHRIEIVCFSLPQPLSNGATVTGTIGWFFRIEKINDGFEKMETFCLLDSQSNAVSRHIANGEHLDAVEINYQEWTMHLGSEDGEILHARAVKNDWFPERLKDKLDAYYSITKIRNYVLSTNIPDLKIGEKLQVQYLVAFDNSKDRSINTWLAVDQTKEKLEQFIEIS